MNEYLAFHELINAVRHVQTTSKLFRNIVSDTVVNHETLPLFTQGLDCFARTFGIFRIDQHGGLRSLVGKRPIKLRKSKLNPVAGRALPKYPHNPS